MTKLLALFALTTALTVGACNNKSNEAPKVVPAPAPAPTETAKPTEPKPGDVAPNPTTQPDNPKPGDPRPASVNGELPPECKDYQAVIESLATCDKVSPDVRAAFSKAYEHTSAGWATLSADAKTALAPTCKTAADAVKQATAACH